MKKTLLTLALVAMAGPATAGDIHGKVTCKGVKNCADAVVYVGAIAGKEFPAPKDHARIDQKNLVFAPTSCRCSWARRSSS